MSPKHPRYLADSIKSDQNIKQVGPILECQARCDFYEYKRNLKLGKQENSAKMEIKTSIGVGKG